MTSEIGSDFYKELPKIELHAHLNGSLSRNTMTELKRHLADKGIVDETNAFFDEFQVGAGDTRNLSDCFQVFSIAHTLTSTPEALSLATRLTLQEFQNEGCCYLELRSTPRRTQHMSKEQYIETIIQTIKTCSVTQTMTTKLIISLNRALPVKDAMDTVAMVVESLQFYPDIVVGVELSGNPLVGNFEEFIPVLNKARDAGLKISLHCGEVCNPDEVLSMLRFEPERIGHAVCVHHKYGGTQETWEMLCRMKTPVEVCLTSNVNTKSVPDYESHHFKELYDAGIPVILCTDDKGVFSTSLTQEYILCADTFNLSHSQMARLALDACQYIFTPTQIKQLQAKIQKFIDKYNL